MRFILFLLCLVPINFCLSQQEIYESKFETKNNNFNAFKAGEKLEYKLSYGFFNASSASLTLKEEFLDGAKVLRATSIGRTTGLARLFFKVDDIYETFFPLDIVKPVKSIRDIYEGGYEREAETIYI